MLTYQFDDFNGVIIDTCSVHEDKASFLSHLKDLLTLVSDHKRLIWLTLPIKKSHLIDVATDLGFVFHNCLETQITLVLRLVEDAYAPFVPTYTLGGGALVINDNNEVLMVKDRWSKGAGYKLPGGHIELGERIEEAVIREVLEETGIEARFDHIVGFATKHPYQFGKSNMYFVCRLTPLTDQINIQDTDEIIDAQWIDFTTYINDEKHSPFNREIVRAAASGIGLKKFELKNNRGVSAKHEVFFIES